MSYKKKTKPLNTKAEAKRGYEIEIDNMILQSFLEGNLSSAARKKVITGLSEELGIDKKTIEQAIAESLDSKVEPEVNSERLNRLKGRLHSRMMKIKEDSKKQEKHENKIESSGNDKLTVQIINIKYGRINEKFKSKPKSNTTPK